MAGFKCWAHTAQQCAADRGGGVPGLAGTLWRTSLAGQTLSSTYKTGDECCLEITKLSARIVFIATNGLCVAAAPLFGVLMELNISRLTGDSVSALHG